MSSHKPTTDPQDEVNRIIKTARTLGVEVDEAVEAERGEADGGPAVFDVGLLLGGSRGGVSLRAIWVQRVHRDSGLESGVVEPELVAFDQRGARRGELLPVEDAQSLPVDAGGPEERLSVAGTIPRLEIAAHGEVDPVESVGVVPRG